MHDLTVHFLLIQLAQRENLYTLDWLYFYFCDHEESLNKNFMRFRQLRSGGCDLRVGGYLNAALL